VEEGSTTAAGAEGPPEVVAATFIKVVSNGGVAHPITLQIIPVN